MPYQQITLAQLRTLVRNRLGSLGTTFFRTAELNAYIQESLQAWNLLTGYWRTRVTIATVANQVWYTLPGSITSAMRMEYNGQPLGYASFHDLDTGRLYWESETTTSGNDVPTSVAMWCPAGLTMVAIWPADAGGKNSLVCDGVAVTPALGADGDYLDIGSEELNHILDYAEHTAMFKEGGAEFQATMPLFKSFLAGAAKRNAMLMASSKFRQAMGMDTSRYAVPRVSKPERAGVR